MWSSESALIEELLKIKESGFAIDNHEIEEGLCCVAAPIRNYLGEVIAAGPLAQSLHGKCVVYGKFTGLHLELGGEELLMMGLRGRAAQVTARLTLSQPGTAVRAPPPCHARR